MLIFMTLQQACYADEELFNIMKTGGATLSSCQSGRGEYPTGGTMGKAFCLFNSLGFVSIKKLLVYFAVRELI